MKTKLTDAAVKLRLSWDEAISLRDKKLDPSEWTGKGKNTWLTEEGMNKLEIAVAVPLAVPTRLKAQWVADAPNPNWVYATIEGRQGKHPVAIPRKLRGKLGDAGKPGKSFEVHAITDVTGTTYRHASLAG